MTTPTTLQSARFMTASKKSLVSLLCLGLLATASDLFAKTLTWQSTSSTAWETAANWYDEGTLATSTTAPAAGDNVTISNSRGATAQPSVTTASQVAGTLVVGNGFTLTISGANGGLKVGDGATGNNDITIQNGGTIINAGTSATATFSINSTSNDKFRIDNGGTFIHNTTRSYTTPFPAGTQNFDTNSTFIFRGASGTATTVVFSGRTFGNLTIESSSGAYTVTAATGTGAATINGNLSIGATGSGTVSWTLAAGTTSAFNIAGNLTVGTGSSITFPEIVFTLVGNLVNNGTMTINGTSGVFTFNGAASTISGSSTTTFSGGVTVNASKTVSLSTGISVPTGKTATVNGTLNCGTNTVSGAGAFTLASGATLGVGSATGVTGNITVSGTKTLDAAANYLFVGTAAQTTAGLPSTVNNLTISNATAIATGGVTLSSDVTVNGTFGLTLGRLITGANKVIIADAGSVSGGSSTAYVDGNLQKVWASTGTKNQSFPIGAGSTYAPCSVASLVLSAAGNLTASTTGSEHANIGSSTIDSSKSANRYWTMTAGGGLTPSTYNASCTFVAADIDGGASSNLFVMEKYNGSTWSRAASTSTTGSTVTGSGFTSFSDFAVGEPAAVSTPPAGVGSSSPANVGRGNSTLLTVAVTPGTFPTSTGVTVTANLSGIGGSSSQTFYDDGSNGDVTGGDNVFSYSATVSTGTTLGAKSLSASIADAQTRTGSATISVTVVGLARVWSGSGANNSIATAANWSTGVAPISPEDGLTFTGSTRTTPSLDSSATTPGLVFDSGASSFTLGATGGSTLTLNGSTGITNDSANAQTINIPLVLGSAQTVKANGAGTLTLGGTVNNNGNLLTVDGANATTITGAVSGAGGITKASAGTLTLSGNNTYGGATLINGGTVVANGGLGIPDGSAVTTASGTTLSLSASEGIGSLSGAGIVALGANSLTNTGSATTTNTGTFTGSGKLIQAGSGTLMLTNSGALGSSFTTRITAGTVELNNGGGLITNLLSTGNKVELAGGTLKLSGNVQANLGINFGSLDIYSDSTLSLNRNSTAQSSTSPNLGFPLDFKGNAALAFAYNDRITNGTTTFSAASHLLEGHGKLTLGAYAVTISGPINESGGSYSFTKDGPGQLNLASINTYSGNTTNLAGVLAVNGTATFGDGTGTLVLGGGDILASNTRAGAPINNPILLTASGTSTIYGDSSTTASRIFPLAGSLSGTTGTLRLGNKASVTNSFHVRLSGGGFTFDRPIVVGDTGFDSTNGSTLLVFYNDNTTAPQVFTGAISGSAAGGIVRTSPSSGTGGTTVLAGDSTFAGGITNSGGYLGIGLDSTPTSGAVTSGPLGAGTLEFQADPNVGIFAYGGPRTIANRIFMNGSGGTLTVQVGGTNDLTFTGTWNVGNSSKFLNVTNTGVTTIAGVITNSSTATFTKSGSGKLVLSGDNLFNGTMTNAAGTLLVHGLNYSNSVVVSSGATLGGNGLLRAVTVGAGGILAPGASVGHLTVTNLTLAATATNVFEFDVAGNTNDTVTVLGALSAGSSRIVINVTGGSLPVGTYRLFDYGTKTGSFNVVANLGSGSADGGLKIDDSTPGQINLVVRANTAPMANNDSFSFNKGVTAKMTIASLLANDTDADSDTLSLYSVDAVTANGVTLVNNGTTLFYTSAITNDDSFTYTITDGYGAVSTATVNITATIATGQTTGSITLSGGDANLQFFGIPGNSYTIQRSGDLSTWTDVTTVTAGSTGVITYTDVAPTPPVYYRLKTN